MLGQLEYHMLKFGALPDPGASMAGIESVTGTVAAADLGFVLVHEHIAASSPGIIASWPELCGGRAALVEAGDRKRSAR
jgi:hypothetical protein